MLSRHPQTPSHKTTHQSHLTHATAAQPILFPSPAILIASHPSYMQNLENSKASTRRPRGKPFISSNHRTDFHPNCALLPSSCNLTAHFMHHQLCEGYRALRGNHSRCAGVVGVSCVSCWRVAGVLARWKGLGKGLIRC